ncbi:hypothetical protein JM18_004030 [Phytophthora kernoviae]|uniref:Uncharacterized protein n=2 Tax=Phytophthora kernoviae TaxID=325452 RepID=A0A8T0LVU6_9STRA|nr:hypothetical protein G195_006650 [Phytophthora kernoviae 00238/432]KAG2522714.1 hypothetical protein JM16_005702 [Phytophthora kernoviae]KAG2524384.1 hypothetical protein JM18_004030 [Phytophthora kernoviae]
MPIVGEDVILTPSLRRRLQTTGSTSTETPEATTATPTSTPTTATPTSTPTTATPTTTAPTPTTTSPSPTTTTATPTATTTTPTATTATPESTTETPTATTATPGATTATPSSTTATPGSTNATPTATSVTPSTSSGSTSSTETTPSATSATTSNSGSASAAVAVVATLIMCAIRRRRETEDDPLSPFELSMDKGYSATPGFNAHNSYNPRATGAVASGSASMQTPPAGHVAAGVAYSQFYDAAATSPGSMNRLESNVDSVQSDNPNPATNGTNLWLSAMEPKDNDSYLSAQESPSGRSSRNSSRNSYDNSSFGVAVDVDQSSQISGHSNKSDEFPDHHKDNDSARGSYEL